MIICRLWVPKAHLYTKIPELTLARNAFAAQRVTADFFERLKINAKELERKHGTAIDVNSLSELQKIKIEELIYKNSSGDSEAIDDNVIGLSIDEFFYLENKDMREAITRYEETQAANLDIIRAQEEQLIESVSLRFQNKIGIRRSLILFAENWFIIVILMCAVVSSSLTIILEASPLWLTSIIIPVLLKLLEQVLKKPFITESVLKNAVCHVWKKYKEFISNSLTKSEKELEEKIIEKCVNETKILQKHKRYFESNTPPHTMLVEI